jgi:hypothetical protein
VVLEVTVVETLSDIGRLLLDGDEDVAGLVVESLFRRVVPDVLDGLSDDGLVVDESLGGDLSEDHDHSTRDMSQAREKGVSDGGVGCSPRELLKEEGKDIPGLGSSLASDLGPGVLGEAGVELWRGKRRRKRKSKERKRRTWFSFGRTRFLFLLRRDEHGRKRRHTIASETASQILSVAYPGEERRESAFFVWELGEFRSVLLEHAMGRMGSERAYQGVPLRRTRR